MLLESVQAVWLHAFGNTGKELVIGCDILALKERWRTKRY
jgi:hypothetical protein